MTEDELESRLKNWADEYGGGRYPNVGWQGVNLLQTLMDHKGFVPSSRGFIPVPIKSMADEVESVVIKMDSGDMERHAKVVRCDYFMPSRTIDSRLSALRRAGHPMSRASYYAILAQGKAYIRGALSRGSDF